MRRRNVRGSDGLVDRVRAGADEMEHRVLLGVSSRREAGLTLCLGHSGRQAEIGDSYETVPVRHLGDTEPPGLIRLIGACARP